MRLYSTISNTQHDSINGAPNPFAKEQVITEISQSGEQRETVYRKSPGRYFFNSQFENAEF